MAYELLYGILKKMRDAIVLIVDTTWRMFVPVLGLTIIGVLFDQQMGTKPIALGMGIIVGFGIAGVLVKMQINRVNRRGLRT